MFTPNKIVKGLSPSNCEDASESSFPVTPELCRSSLYGLGPSEEFAYGALPVSCIKDAHARLIRTVSEHRCELAKHYLEIAPRLASDYLVQIHSPYGISEARFEELESEIVERYRGALNSSAYKMLRQQLTDSSSRLDQVTHAINSCPLLLRDVVMERLRSAALADRILGEETCVNVEISVTPTVSPCYGVEGRAMAVARALKQRIPSVSLTTSGPSSTVFEKEWERLTHNKKMSGGSESKGELSLCFYPSERSNPVLDRPFAAFIPLVKAFNKVTPPKACGGSLVSNDLASVFGTLPIDSHLAALSVEKQNLTAAELVEARKDWLKRNCNFAQVEALQRLELYEGWQGACAIWGLAYVQNKDVLVKELATLESLLKRSSERFPLIAEGKQVVVHVKLGELSSSERFFNEAFAAGIRFISPQGDVIDGAKGDFFGVCPPRVTVMVHSQIEHAEFANGMATLSGTLVRSSSTGEWINFPVWVTGSASWLEAMSAGAPFRHDNNDATKVKTPQLEALLRKHFILSSGTVPTWRESVEYSSSRVQNYLLGDVATSERYLDLERWTAEAKGLAESVMSISSIDEVVIALARIALSRNSSTESF